MTHTGDFPTFEDFFKAIAGVDEPYEWQKSLAEHVEEQGFPDQIAVPTGMGKTSVIAIWLYELARQAHLGQSRTAQPRTVPMRLFYVVNRRSVVDQGDHYAKALQEGLGDPKRDQVLEPVRRALATLLPPGDDRLLVTAAIHGESPDDKAWMRATGATAVSLTPTQLVSRALMRGVNVSPGTRSIHAGLVGVDRLVVFDEPHLSTPAITTIWDQERLQSRAEHLGVPLGKTVLLGATIPDPEGGQKNSETFSFDAAKNLENPEARRRLLAKKTLEIVPVKATSPATLGSQAKRFVEQMSADGNDRLLLVLNTVDAAQRVYQSLAKMPVKKRPPNLRLLTSRFRGVDKPSATKLGSGPLVLVATQTVEVGLDISFQALFTEATSFDSLVQRLGRLNRSGEDEDATCWLIAAGGAGKTGSDSTFSVSKSTEHIYGEPQVLAALELLESHEKDGLVDVSPLALKKMRDEEGGNLQKPLPRAATLHSPLTPVIVQTRPTPASDIPLEAFIAGPDEQAALEVEVAWRNELWPLDTPEKKDAAAPLAGEYVKVPMVHLRAFLEDRRVNDPVSDTQDLDEKATRGGRLPLERAEQFRVLNPGASSWQTVRETWRIAPGAKVVLDAALGGYNQQLGWSPASREPVETVQLRALEAALQAQVKSAEFREPKRLNLVVDDGLSTEAKNAAQAQPAGTAAALKAERVAGLVEEVRDANQEFAASSSEDPRVSEVAADALALQANLLIDELTGGQGSALSTRQVTQGASRAGVVLGVRLRTASQSGGDLHPVFLDAHLAQVGAWAGDAARTVGLNEGLVDALVEAGRYHDAGKAWGPYQQWYGVDEGNQPGRPLAKSLPEVEPRGIRRKVRAPSAHGVPRGWRHELHSLGLMPRDVVGRRLVSHLVVSHHGWGRPLFALHEVASGDRAAEMVLTPGGAGLADQFGALNEKFGPWGLAYLEAVLRLADWTASAAPDWDVEDAGLDTLAPHGLAQDLGAARSGTFEHRLIGLAQFPVGSWFAAVGLLAAAEGLGDENARLRWEGSGGLEAVAPTLPVLISRFSLEELIEAVVDSDQWGRAKVLLSEHHCRPFTVKGQKMGPAGALRGLLLAADEPGRRLGLLLGSVTDAAPADKVGVPMAIPAFPNNSSFPAAAWGVVGSSNAVERVQDALLNPNAGYSIGAVDGGLDRPQDYDPAVTGNVGKDRRLVRSTLAPLSLWGMTVWGTVPPRGFGCGPNRISLPLPEEPASLGEIRALTIAGSSAGAKEKVGCRWMLDGGKVFDGSSKQEWWVASPLFQG